MSTIIAEAKEIRKNGNGKGNGTDVAAVKPLGQPTDQKPTSQKHVAETKPEPATHQKPQLTLEQKIEKVETLKTLIEKREKLEASRKKLTAFVVGANQFSENIVLTDENGNTFKTSNTEVFAKVVDTIQTTLVSKIAEIENQIEF